ncbi:MAG: hypothetical protein ACRC8S_11715 [Fimbriiglobus sp.]
MRRTMRPASLNRYVYSSSDPVNRADPTGLVDLAEVLARTAVQNLILAIAKPLFKPVASTVITGLIGLATGNDLFNPSRFSAGQITVNAGFTGSIGPVAASLAGGLELLSFVGPGASRPGVALYSYLGVSLGNAGGTGASAGAQGGLGAVFDARTPYDYAGGSIGFTGSVGFLDITRAETVVRTFQYMEIINYPGAGTFDTVRRTLTSTAVRDVVYGSVSASAGFSVSTSGFTDNDGVERKSHALTFYVGFGVGMNAGKSNSLTIGYAYYDLLDEY